MLASQSYDLVVIGGGIQGTAIAQAAAADGYRVLVLEKTGLAAGTSSRSSKLIHGGLRYLEQGHFGLVRESLRERSQLLQLAPALVKLNPFYIPIYQTTSRGKWTIRAGLTLYGLLAGLGTASRFRSVPRAEWAALDGLSTVGLTHVFQYWDAQTDDRLLTQALMHSAMKLGAELRCPAEFIQANLTQDGCELTYRWQNQSLHCTAAVIINAAGPWVNQILYNITPSPPTLPIELVQGTHLVLEEKPDSGCYYLESPVDQRAIFVLPWYQHTLLGTTETVFTGAPEACHPLAEEEAYLIECFHHYFPNRKVVVREKFSGLRVLPKTQGAAFSRSRDIQLLCDNADRPRIITLYGGKLTVSRATAQKVLRMAAPSLPQRDPKANLAELPIELPPSPSEYV
ncbi:MAG: FAD-dependent oxidoreductase [Nitrosomonas sp.]|nr:FAD-dependent oxidoreductase [Nitrosomonas sp.]